MALRIDSFEVDVTVRRKRPTKRGRPPDRAGRGMPLGPIHAASDVPSHGNGDSRMSGSAVTSKASVAEKVLARAEPPTQITPAVPAPIPEITGGMPRFMSPPIQAPAPRPLPTARVAAPAPLPQAAAGGFRPMFKRLGPPSRETPRDGAMTLPAGGTGRPLDEATRRHMEQFFAADLADVRIHADADAAALAKNQGAEALTIGRDIYFAKDKFDPTGSQGQALLAHELTHVLQQTSFSPRSVQRFIRGRSVDRFEAEAEAVAAFLLLREGVDAGGLVVERYRSLYATNRPATDAEHVRLEKLAIEALKTCSEIVREKHPELLKDGRTLDRVTVDVDISLARAGDLEAGQVWGRRLAEALIAAASGKAEGIPAPTVAPGIAAMASPDGGTDGPKDAGPPDAGADGQYVTLETYRIARSPEQQRKDMEDLVVAK